MYGQIKLPRLINDGMVLQRDTIAKVWGWDRPGQTIQLHFLNKQYSTTTDHNGEWNIHLPAQPAGGPYSMIIEGSSRITVKDILFGDVWVCSGQSNMEFTMEIVKKKYAHIISNSSNPFIRQFEARDSYDFRGPANDFKSGSWTSADPQTVLNFSAVAYFFAKSLYERYKIPIGIINNAVGGSPAAAWISEESIKKFPHYYKEFQQYKDTQFVASVDSTNWANIRNWNKEVNNKDQGLLYNWKYAPDEYQTWQNFNVPGYWADTHIGNINGVIWFSKKINLLNIDTASTYTLHLGHLVDADSTFINGNFVGSVPFRFGQRSYEISGKVLQEGENTIVIRLINERGKGGFIPDKPYQLTGNRDTILLTGSWKYKIGATMPPQPEYVFLRWKPVGLFNAMTAPLLNYSVKGIVWYQGESNVDRPSEYLSLMKALITDWRKHWQNDQLPFLYVQLASYLPAFEKPTESNWAIVRQAQMETLSVPHTGMAVAIDIGEWNDVHPLNKLDVGERLALQAAAIVYKEKIDFSGPIAISAKRKGKKVAIQFAHTGSGLNTKHNKKLNHFAIGDSSGNFKWVDAKIKGSSVILNCQGISAPYIVRYAWADNPATANLYNKEGLPASPFQLLIH